MRWLQSLPVMPTVIGKLIWGGNGRAAGLSTGFGGIAYQNAILTLQHLPKENSTTTSVLS